MRINTFCKIASEVANSIEEPKEDKNDGRFAATKLMTILGLLGGGVIGASQGSMYGTNPIISALGGAMSGAGRGFLTGGAVDLGRAGINYFTDQNK